LVCTCSSDLWTPDRCRPRQTRLPRHL